jgi:glycosyltransferase involved in cell wall biosynthesis
MDSVVAQTCKSWQMIVVDDGSTDATAEIVGRHPGKAEYHYQANAGPSVARNRGLDVARGEFVVFLDSDDLLVPSKLTDQLACFESDSGLDLVHSGWQLIDRNARHIDFVEPWELADELDLKGFLKCQAFTLGPLMFRRRLLLSIGGFNPLLRQAEDVDLILKAMANGAKATWLRKSTLLYRQHEGAATQNAVERVAAVNRVFAAFFSRRDLAADIAGMERQVRFNLLMWSVWQLYLAGDHAGIPRLLNQSLEFLDGSKRQALHIWINRIMQMSRVNKRHKSPHELRAFLSLCKVAIEGAGESVTDSGYG